MLYWEVFLFAFVSHTCLSVWFVFILMQQEDENLIQAELGCETDTGQRYIQGKEIMSTFEVIISGYAGWFALFFLFSIIIILNTVSTVWALAH